MKGALALTAVLALAGCERSHLTDEPVAHPTGPTARPDLSADVATVRVNPGADPMHLHIVVVREGHDPHEVEVSLHPSPEALAPAFTDLSHGARLVVVPDPQLAHGDAVAVLDAMRAAGFTHFALSR